jgi:hypothetical protein
MTESVKATRAIVTPGSMTIGTLTSTGAIAAVVLAMWVTPQEPAQAEPRFSTTVDVVCYHFDGQTLARRDLCKMENFDTSSVITWTDGVQTRIRWIARSSQVPALDGVNAVEYFRDPDSLEVIERGANRNPIRCLQAVGGESSVCWR